MDLLYVAYAVGMKDDSNLGVAKVGIAKSDIDKRIRSLNSTRMPMKVELEAGFDFSGLALTARDAEYIVHSLLAHDRVNGEWFKDPGEDLVDRVRKAVTRMGAVNYQSRDAVVVEMNNKQGRALDQMKSVFEPLRDELQSLEIPWEYMTWKVGIDTAIGRLQVNVNRNDLYLMLSNTDSVEDVRALTGLNWQQLEYKKRVNVIAEELISFLRKVGPLIDE